MVTVITPVLNAVSTIELTLRSVAAQRYDRLEHIVVDGGSTDGTIDVLKSFRSTAPFRWTTSLDAGMYAAINKGITMARGDILAYLNADDLYFPWTLECVVPPLGSHGTDLVFGDILMIARRETRTKSAWMQFYPEFDSRIYAFEVIMGQPSVFWKRHVSDTIGGFDDRLRYSGDFEYWLRAAAAGFKYRKIDEVLAVEVQHEGALSTLYPERVRDEILWVRRGLVFQPRVFPRLRRYERLLGWRAAVLRFALNSWQREPARWKNGIRFLRSANVRVRPFDAMMLLLPIGLPATWSLWRGDAGRIESTLLKEISEFSPRPPTTASPDN
jgi:glycosyltransferase involved in cell wall biosynthesis